MIKWLIALSMLVLCSCNFPNGVDAVKEASGLTGSENTWMEKAKEDAVKKATGNDAITAPCEAYEQTIPGIPVWPGIRVGGMFTKKSIILPPVDIEEEFSRRLMKHRIEQRVYWSDKLNKGIMLGFIILVVGLVVKLWAELRVGVKIAVGGFFFSCFCVACQWYFDYIPYIAAGSVLAVVVYIIWEIYDEKASEKSENELASTVEVVKEKLRDNDLGHLWEETKGEILHSKRTQKRVSKFKNKVDKVKKSVEQSLHRKLAD